MNLPQDDAIPDALPDVPPDTPEGNSPATGPDGADAERVEPASPEASASQDAPASQGAPAMGVAACAALLRQHFPALFGGKPRPLKLRIQADIQQRQPGVFPKQVLSAFLRRYTASDAYLKAMTTEAHRYDLDGQPAGEVTEEHREVARQSLAQRRSRDDARRAQERAERQFRAALLRDYESTTLTRENFCALKGVAVDQLDTQLEQARREREERRQYLAQLLADFRASGKRVPEFATERGLHPGQLDRLLREAGWRAGPPPAPARGPQGRPGDARGGERRGRGDPGRDGEPRRDRGPRPDRPKRP